VKDFWKKASSLTHLLKKAVKFEQIEKCERALKELRQRSTTTSILKLPVESKEYTIYSDAAKNGLRCVLMQEDKVVVCLLTAQAL